MTHNYDIYLCVDHKMLIMYTAWADFVGGASSDGHSLNDTFSKVLSGAMQGVRY